MKTLTKIVLLSLFVMLAACQPAPTQYLNPTTVPAPTTAAPVYTENAPEGMGGSNEAAESCFELDGDIEPATVWSNGTSLDINNTAVNIAVGTDRLTIDQFVWLYRAEWDCNWLHQPALPHESVRQYYSFAFNFSAPAGLYSFDGVVCELHLDETRNGRGLDNPIARTTNGLPVENGNMLQFRVNPVQTNDPGAELAWGRIMCDASPVNGASLTRIGD